MAFSLKNGFLVSGLGEESFLRKPRGVSLISSSSSSSPNLRESKSAAFPSLKIDFPGKSLVFSDQKAGPPSKFTLHAQASVCISRSLRWWEKTLQPNMIEIQSAQNLVDSLLLAGDKLVIVDFYSPGCGGCKALHPKICQLAESNPEAIFLKVNFEELKTLCHGLHVHVLPFFRFYRGAEGRLCSFSCTNATIKKFKAALEKHGTDRCSVGPTKGLDESELTNLESVGEISRKDSKFVFSQKEIFNDLVLKNMDLSLMSGARKKKMDMEEENAAL